MWLKEQWDKLPDNWKYEIRSGAHTFIAAALGEWALSGGGIPTTKEAFAGLLFAMLRAGVKAVSVLLIPAKKTDSSSDVKGV